METISSLFKLRSNKITDESYQNMFITLNGFEVLINILECNVEDCVVIRLIFYRNALLLFNKFEKI